MAILHARVQPMTFTSVGDPQSTLTTVSPSTGFHDMKNGVPHVEKKKPSEKKTWLWTGANWITLACSHCLSKEHAPPRIYPVPENLMQMKTSAS